jgi:hypothetical protein
VHALLALELLGERGAGETQYSLSYLTCLRLGELCLNFKATGHADAAFKQWLEPSSHYKVEARPIPLKEAIDILGPHLSANLSIWRSDHDLKPVHAWFHSVREAAQKRLEAKTTFMKSRMATGRHPDTDPTFWQGWQEPMMPSTPKTRLEESLGISLAGWFEDKDRLQAISIILPSSIVFALYVVLRTRHHRRKRQIVAVLHRQDDGR